MLRGNGDILYVGGSGPGNYSTIQTAINAASEGSLIIVYGKTYHENVVLNKSHLTLRGVQGGKSFPFVSAGSGNWAFFFENDSCAIENFTAMNGRTAAIYIVSNHNTIINCNTIDYWLGVLISGGDFNNVSYCSMSGNGLRGIELRSSNNNTFIGNHISEQGQYAILIGGSAHNWIRQNICEQCPIQIENSPMNLVEENTIVNDSKGLVLTNSNFSKVLCNNFVNNGLSVNGPLDELLSYTVEGNLNNGKPMMYYKNLNGVIVPKDVGEIILVNCSHFLIENSSNCEHRLLIFYSSNITITRNSCLEYIQLVHSQNNIISNNRLVDVWGGIALDHSNRNVIANNTVKNKGSSAGIKISSSNDDIIENNLISSCEFGVDISGTRMSICNNSIKNISAWAISISIDDSKVCNNILYNGEEGITITGSNNILNGNYIESCHVGIDSGSSSSTISNNTITKNRIGIALFYSTDKVILNQIQWNVIGIFAFSSEAFIEKNNIVKNLIDSSFSCFQLRGIVFLKWKNNYWGFFHLFRKHILGSIVILFPIGYYSGFSIFLPWLKSDRRPAHTPYNITPN